MKLLVKMSLVACCLAVCACDGVNPAVEIEVLLQYRKFLFESTAFDYCGCSYSDEDVGIAAHGYTDDDVLRFYLSEHGHERESMEFFRLVRDVEADARKNGGSMDWNMVERLKGALMSQKGLVRSRSERFSAFCYERNLMRLLYSVARVVEFSRPSSDFPGDFAFRALPEDLFSIDLSECEWVSVRRDWMSEARVFRNLLLTSCHLDYSAAADILRLSDIEDERLRSFADDGNFRLLGGLGKWVMVFGSRRTTDFSRISASVFLCPQIAGRRPMFLSHDYSRRRERIFREGENADGKVVVVRRGRMVAEKK